MSNDILGLGDVSEPPSSVAAPGEGAATGVRERTGAALAGSGVGVFLRKQCGDYWRIHGSNALAIIRRLKTLPPAEKETALRELYDNLTRFSRSPDMVSKTQEYAHGRSMAVRSPLGVWTDHYGDISSLLPPTEVSRRAWLFHRFAKEFRTIEYCGSPPPVINSFHGHGYQEDPSVSDGLWTRFLDDPSESGITALLKREEVAPNDPVIALERKLRNLSALPLLATGASNQARIVQLVREVLGENGQHLRDFAGRITPLAVRIAHRRSVSKREWVSQALPYAIRLSEVLDRMGLASASPDELWKRRGELRAALTGLFPSISDLCATFNKPDVEGVVETILYRHPTKEANDDSRGMHPAAFKVSVLSSVADHVEYVGKDNQKTVEGVIDDVLFDALPTEETAENRIKFAHKKVYHGIPSIFPGRTTLESGLRGECGKQETRLSRLAARLGVSVRRDGLDLIISPVR